MTKKKSLRTWAVDEATNDALLMIMDNHPSEEVIKGGTSGETALMNTIVTEYLMSTLGKMNWMTTQKKHVKEIRECKLVQNAIHGADEED